MTVAFGDCEAAIAALRADPSLAGPLASDSACFLWSASGTRLLWASERARELGAALTDGDGAIDPNTPLGRCLQALSAGQALRDTARLERVRLGAAALQPPTTFACRRVAWPGGEGLLTCIIGPLPSLRHVIRPSTGLRGSGSALPRPPAAEMQQQGRTGAPVSEPARRFLWQTDAEGRFTMISDAFVGMLAAGRTDLIGRAWRDLAGEVVADPDGAVAAGFASHAPWSHARSLWQLPGHKVLVAIMAASPMRDEGGFAGFRGFGRFRPGEIQPGDIAQSEPPESAEANPATEAEAAPIVATETELRVPESGSPGSGSSSGEAEAEPKDHSLAAPYTTAHPLHPMFQAMFDASLSGLSHLMGGRPSAAPDDAGATAAVEGAEAHGGSAPDLQRTASDAEGPDEGGPGPAASDEALEPDSSLATAAPPSIPAEEPEASAPSEPLAFQDLHTRVGAELGPAPLQLPGPGAPDAEASDARRSDPSATGARQGLSFGERGAFREIARVLGARLDPGSDLMIEPRESADVIQLRQPRLEPDAMRLLDDVPIGIIVFRGDTLLFANRHLLDLAGYPDLHTLTAAGGLSALVLGGVQALCRDMPESAGPMLVTRLGRHIPAVVQRGETEWRDSVASLALLSALAAEDPQAQVRALEDELDAGTRRLDETRAVLDLAADGIVMLDRSGRILSLNRSAEILFGYGQGEVAGEAFDVLLAPDSHAAAVRALEAIRNETESPGAVELSGRSRQGESLQLEVSFGHTGQGEHAPICAILRDMEPVRQAESALARAKRASDRANRQAAEFLARISHEVRTPLNAIIGFAEMMLEERFGPVGTERYKSYLADIRDSGGQVIKLVDDCVDLANAITGRFEIPDDGIDLNEAVIETVAAQQPAAARARIVVRTSFASALPRLFVDGRSLRQVVDNILSNAIRFTEPGGQVIASTALTDRGEIALRVRDTGIGMSEGEIEIALEPFRQVSALRPEGRGLGLPLAKALVEANRGTLAITSRPGAGTLVEILFPAAGPQASLGPPEAGARRRNG